MKYLILGLLCLIVLPSSMAQDADSGEDTLHVAVDCDLLVFDRFEASDALARWGEENGGFFTWKSEEAVRLRVPDEAVAGFRDYVDSVGESVLRYDQATIDVREELMRSRSALEAREEILEKNLGYLDSSDVEGTLELEREIRRLMTEIDQHRGRLRRLEHDRRMAVIQVNLSFQHRSLPDARPSNFQWINGVDFYSFMNANMTQAGGLGMGTDPVALPEGFARIGRRPSFRAMTPEGVRLRIRSVDNYPEQSQDFWADALASYLMEHGYVSIEEQPESHWTDTEGFRVALWALPLGTEDYVYLTGLRIRKGKVDILEIAGRAREAMDYIVE